jgi:trehalose 6-phosphate phosphatase
MGQANTNLMLRSAEDRAGEQRAPHFDLRSVAVLLDVDGTILEIAPAPNLVRVPEALVDVLSRLNARTEGALALISGRPLHDIDRLFEPLKLAAIGCHGAEVRSGPGHDCLTHAPTLDARLRARLSELGRIGGGVVIEDKAYAVALHYRLAPRLARVLLMEVERIAADFALTGIELLHGKEVIEVKSARVNKGTAFRDLMREPPFAARRPVFVGDDVTDEDVFAALPEFDGYGISVGRAIPGAQFSFPRAGDVREWLAFLADGK